ncbi:MAG: hypothetical protein ABJC74_00590, partial [Gemmatimonadota bacterium]
IFSAGYATFSLTDKGVPDTASIALPSLERGTPPGLRSALARQLPSCRFKISRSADRRRVRAHVAFTAGQLAITEIVPVPPDDSLGAAIVGLMPRPGVRYTIGDDSLEEKPDVGCDDVEVISGEFSSNQPVSAQEIIHEIERRPHVMIHFTVAPSGWVDTASIQFDASGIGQQAQVIKRRLMKCRWTPGRVHGWPVSVRMERSERL